MSNKLLLTLITPVIPLGFYRGVKDYSWNIKKYNNREYFYSSALGYGLLGTFVYLCPMLIANNVAKELYRAEINLRNMENLKNSEYYNELL